MNEGKSFLKRMFTYRTINFILYALFVLVIIALFIFF